MSNTQTEQEEPKAADLTIQDLGSLKQIIDVASQRGAFKPTEMVQVGQTYAKLEAFLDEIARQQKAAESSKVAEEAPLGE
jgi:hypothetical protein